MTESFSSSIVKITPDGQVVISDYLDDGETIYSQEAAEQLAEKARKEHDVEADDHDDESEKEETVTEKNNGENAVVPSNPENASDNVQSETLQEVPAQDAANRETNAEADNDTKTAKH